MAGAEVLVPRSAPNVHQEAPGSHFAGAVVTGVGLARPGEVQKSLPTHTRLMPRQSPELPPKTGQLASPSHSPHCCIPLPHMKVPLASAPGMGQLTATGPGAKAPNYTDVKTKATLEGCFFFLPLGSFLIKPEHLLWQCTQSGKKLWSVIKHPSEAATTSLLLPRRVAHQKERQELK